MDYTSRSQIARVLTESWVASNGYCLACESDCILQTPTNTQARDFECPECGHPYELKSSIRPFGKAIVDGAYSALMHRIETKSVPSFLLMRYSETSVITELMAVHRSLITAELVYERKPLGPTARRAGWVGCNILFSQIPPEGRIQLIKDGVALPKTPNREIFIATERLASLPSQDRSWSRALLNCLHSLPDTSFTLSQAYLFEPELSRLYPENKNIRPKIRQQLQVLRDAGLVNFVGRGTYDLAFKLAANE